MILSPYWMWLTSSPIICYCLSSFPAAKRAIDLYLVDFSAILFKKSSVSWPRLTPEVYYSKRKLGYCVVGFLFQCLGGVAGGEGEATRSPLSIKSPLNHDCLSSATNHCSHLPPRLCLSSVSVNFWKKIRYVSSLLTCIQRFSHKVQLSYHSNQVSLYSCLPHFLISWPLWVWDSGCSLNRPYPFFLFLAVPHSMCWILIPWPGVEPVPPASEARSLNHWTDREVPHRFSCCHALSCISFWLESSVQLISVSGWVSHIYFAVSLTLWRPFWAFLHPAKIMLPFLVPHSSFEGDILRDRAVFFLQSSGHAIWTC